MSATEALSKNAVKPGLWTKVQEDSKLKAGGSQIVLELPRRMEGQDLSDLISIMTRPSTSMSIL